MQVLVCLHYLICLCLTLTSLQYLQAGVPSAHNLKSGLFANVKCKGLMDCFLTSMLCVTRVLYGVSHYLMPSHSFFLGLI